jgi:pilus assembly protein CpaF
VVTLTAVNIRKFVVKASRLRELVELGTLTAQAAEFLDACVVAGLNIVVAGGTWADNPWTRPPHAPCSTNTPIT